MSIDKDALYELTPREFERLCAEVLKAEGYRNVALVGGPADQGVDISAEHEGRRVAVQVKHTKRPLSTDDVHRIIHQVRASSYKPAELLIITSSPIPSSLGDAIQHIATDINVRFMGQDEVLRALNEHTEVRRTNLAPAEKRTKRQLWELGFGMAAGLASLIGLLTNLVSTFVFGPEKPALHQRIETVERAIDSLKDLERQLTDVKQDMVKTEQAARAIEEEYAKAKELEKLTDEQFSAIRAALQRQSWVRTALDYFLGFVLGVGASLTASVIYSRARLRSALTKE